MPWTPFLDSLGSPFCLLRYLRKDFAQIDDRQVLQLVDDRNNLLPHGLSDGKGGKGMKLRCGRSPCHRPRYEAFVIPFLIFQNAAVFQTDCDAARHLRRKPVAVLLTGPDYDSSMKLLNVFSQNSF